MFLDTIKTRYQALGCAPTRGCTPAEIRLLAQHLDRTLPAAYAEFLAWAGHDAGDLFFLDAEEYTYADIPEFQTVAQNDLTESGMAFSLPDDAIVIQLAFPLQFAFIRSSEGDDPQQVSLFCRGGQEAKNQYDSRAKPNLPDWRSTMPTSTRYDTIAAQLSMHLPTLRPRLRDPLVCALVGMSQTVSAQQRAIAGAMPLQTKQQSKIQRLRRLLDTATLTATAVYQPIVRAALTGLQRQRVHLLLDRVVLTKSQNVLVVS